MQERHQQNWHKWRHQVFGTYIYKGSTNSPENKDQEQEIKDTLLSVK